MFIYFKVKSFQTSREVHLGLAATQKDWESTHLLSAKISCSLSASFLIPPKFPLCSSTWCLPTPTAQLTTEPFFGWKHISLCIPQIWGESVPPHMLVAPARHMAQPSQPCCWHTALPTHPRATSGCLTFIPINRHSSSYVWWIQLCTCDRVSRADEFSFKAWIKDTFFPPKSLCSAAFVL